MSLICPVPQEELVKVKHPLIMFDILHSYAALLMDFAEREHFCTKLEQAFRTRIHFAQACGMDQGYHSTIKKGAIYRTKVSSCSASVTHTYGFILLFPFQRVFHYLYKMKE